MKTLSGEFQQCSQNKCSRINVLSFLYSHCSDENKELTVSYSVNGKTYYGVLLADSSIAKSSCNFHDQFMQPPPPQNFPHPAQLPQIYPQLANLQPSQPPLANIQPPKPPLANLQPTSKQSKASSQTPKASSQPPKASSQPQKASSQPPQACNCISYLNGKGTCHSNICSCKKNNIKCNVLCHINTENICTNSN